MLNRSTSLLLRHLNWRLLLVQLLLQWCFANSIWQFALLWDLPLSPVFTSANPEPVLGPGPMLGISVQRQLDYMLVLSTFPHLASLLALLLSLLLFRKKRWFWVSAILPFLVIVSLQYLGLTFRGVLNDLSGHLHFNLHNPGFRFFSTGLLLLTGGVLLLYAKPIHRFISGRRMA